MFTDKQWEMTEKQIFACVSQYAQDVTGLCFKLNEMFKLVVEDPDKFKTKLDLFTDDYIIDMKNLKTKQESDVVATQTKITELEAE